MKASVYLGPERVELRNVAEPKPCDDEVLIKVARAGFVRYGFAYLFRVTWISGCKIPLVMGHEMCG